MNNPIGYSFNADTYCPACSEIELGQDPDTEDLEDEEGNPIHAIFSIDEAGNTPTHCGRCHAFIDDSWHGETVNYAIEALANWVITSSAGTWASSSEEAKSVTVLDTWAENLRWCIMSRRDEAILEAFLSLRDGKPREAARGLLEYVLELEEREDPGNEDLDGKKDYDEPDEPAPWNSGRGELSAGGALWSSGEDRDTRPLPTN